MKTILAAGCSLLVSACVCQSSITVVNGGFEDPVTYDGAPFVGSWEGFSGGGAVAANSAVMPRTGSQSLNLSIATTANTFAGAFQDITGLSAGIGYILSGWHATSSSPLDVGVEVRIEWRNSISNIEISRTPNSTPIPTAVYSAFSLTATAPVGADTARLVYAIQSFSTFPLGNGTVYVDDVSFTVPEASTWYAGIGLSLGMLGTFVRKIRK